MSLETWVSQHQPEKRKRSTGSTFQELIRGNLDDWEAGGLGLTETCPRFVGAVDGKGRAVGRLVAKGDVDYVGDYNGRAVKFDAKSSKNLTRFDLGLIRDHQIAKLRKVHRRGGLAGLLIEFSELPGGPRYYWLPWLALSAYVGAAQSAAALAPAGKRAKEQSVRLAAIQADAIEVTRKGKALDLLTVMQRLTTPGVLP